MTPEEVSITPADCVRPTFPGAGLKLRSGSGNLPHAPVPYIEPNPADAAARYRYLELRAVVD
jgi:hypothetical protein